MSNCKSNKSKKASNKNHSQNDFNSFRIEQLEPRILMSATAALSLRTERGNPFWRTAALSLRAERGNPFRG